MFLAGMLDLPHSTRALPYNGKRIYLKFYNNSIKMGHSPSTANVIAWTAVERKYYCDQKGEWKAFRDANDYDTTTTDDDDEEEEDEDDDDDIGD
uniref:ChaB domain protein 2 n=1 Tax=Lymantria dispar multicapsid nuclear polyhedrosis virus TaxID=10449 RepID=A0A1B1MR30_NPVLD|nr:ChaB domain protein 2 [Lymantria dispar multiple nucleopolyhedrovirus]